jgi:electron transfer flavoprotein beta subunit
MLGLPFVAYVSKVEEVADGRMTVERMVEDGHEVIEAPLPAVITVVKEINVPRLPSLRGITKSKRVEIPVWTAGDLKVDEERIGLTGSATWVVKVFFPQRVQQGEVLEGEPENQVDALIEKLRELKIA